MISSFLFKPVELKVVNRIVGYKSLESALGVQKAIDVVWLAEGDSVMLLECVDLKTTLILKLMLDSGEVLFVDSFDLERKDEPNSTFC